MKIISARLLGQAHTPSQVMDTPFPQVAVFGRSNVGKSSVLAGLMGRRGLVKVSSTPGKTRALYYYLVNERLVLVDLPGYGYSRAPRETSVGWRPLVLAYLEGPAPPVLALHLIDIRRPPTKDDHAVRSLIADRRIPCLVAATKADKVSRSEQLRSAAAIARELEVDRERVVPVSTLDPRAPITALWQPILDALK